MKEDKTGLGKRAWAIQGATWSQVSKITGGNQKFKIPQTILTPPNFSGMGFLSRHGPGGQLLNALQSIGFT